MLCKPYNSINKNKNVWFYLKAMKKDKSLLGIVELRDKIFHRKKNKDISDSFLAYAILKEKLLLKVYRNSYIIIML